MAVGSASDEGSVRIACFVRYCRLAKASEEGKAPTETRDLTHSDESVSRNPGPRAPLLKGATVESASELGSNVPNGSVNGRAVRTRMTMAHNWCAYLVERTLRVSLVKPGLDSEYDGRVTLR